MDKYKCFRSGQEEDAIAVAQSVRADFAELVSVLERQLANVGHDDERARAHILEAKTAAERGVKLSDQLLQSLKASEKN